MAYGSEDVFVRGDAISLMQLTIASESQMVQEAKCLIERVQQE